MAVNKIFLDTDGLTVGNGQLVTSGNSVSIANALLVGGNLYAPTLGISGNSSITGVLTVAGRIIASNTQNSSNTTTGAIVTSGGMGVAGNTNIGGALSVTGVSSFGTAVFGGNLTTTGSISGANVTTTTNVATIGAAAYFVANGNVGIGTSSPGAMLAVTGSTTTLSSLLTNISEPASISATAATGTINYDITTQSVLYYTSNASANWTVNFRGSSGVSLNTLMATGQSLTVAFLVTQGTTAYYNNAVQVDGTSVTPKYQGGTAWSAGNASSIDIYTYTIVKTGSAAFTVFATQTQFK